MTDFTHAFSLQRPYNRHGREVFDLTPERISALEMALESDRGRIINSAAVRRLQQKTQVFPLERNAAVRSRLTHSLEVQQTGRFIARTIYKHLGGQAEEMGLSGLERCVETLVEMACLMHDIGNPPFGHFGEAALSRWFSEHLEHLPGFDGIGPDDDSLAAALMRELASFEGNAQAIRLISNLLRLNLTYVQAATVFKYTRRATEPRPETDHPLNYLQKKPGFYYSERHFVAGMQEALAMVPGHRHPLAYIMEAADDIAYCLADMEDGVDKGLLSHTDLAADLKTEFALQRPDDGHQAHFNGRSFNELVDYALSRSTEEIINREHEFFLWLRVNLIHPLVDHAARAFIEHRQSVRAGNLNRALLEDGSPCHSVIKTFKNVAMARIFTVPEVETLELQGYRIITGLLDHYRPLLTLSTADFTRLLDGDKKGLLVESRLVKRLPNKHVKAYLAVRDDTPDGILPEQWELYCRCRLIQDMVSGMTDQFALDEFHTLSATGPL